MEISHIEHVGIAVTSLDEAIPFYENMLGLKCFAIEEVAEDEVPEGTAVPIEELLAKAEAEAATDAE